MRVSRLVVLAGSIQLGGAVLTGIGASVNTVLYGLGWLLLLPGSLITMAIPLRSIGAAPLVSKLGMDAAAFENLAYIPVSILLNCICFAIVGKYLLFRKRRR
jgi:hypothetical protein